MVRGVKYLKQGHEPGNLQQLPLMIAAVSELDVTAKTSVPTRTEIREYPILRYRCE